MTTVSGANDNACRIIAIWPTYRVRLALGLINIPLCYYLIFAQFLQVAIRYKFHITAHRQLVGRGFITEPIGLKLLTECGKSTCILNISSPHQANRTNLRHTNSIPSSIHNIFQYICVNIFAPINRRQQTGLNYSLCRNVVLSLQLVSLELATCLLETQ